MSPHLPPLRPVVDQEGPTALPISNIQRDLDFSVRKLLSQDVFERFLTDSVSL